MEAFPLPDFKPGNPFLEDHVSCGMDLQNATTNPKLEGVYVMSSGMNRSYDLYIVDSKTGQRIGITLERGE